MRGIYRPLLGDEALDLAPALARDDAQARC